MHSTLNLFMTRKFEKRGHLILIGGAEDRTEEKVVLSNVVKYTQATNIVVIPSASGYPVGLGEDYFYAFSKLGVPEVHILDLRTPEDCTKPEHLEKLQKCNLVFMTGGDQVRLFNVIGNTPVHNIIRERNFHDGLSVAGTSAGAAVVSNPMIYDGNMLGLYKGRVHFSEGLGLLENITVDTHFLCTGICNLGIGVGENTGLFIKPDFTADVIGTGMVTIVNTGNLSYNNYHDITEDMPISIQGIESGFLQHGTSFDLKTWKIISSNPMKISNKLIEEMES